MILDRGALSVRHAAADDDARFALTGVLIEPHALGGRVMATNGALLVVVDSVNQGALFSEAEEFPLPAGHIELGRTLVPAALLELVERAIPKQVPGRVAAVAMRSVGAESLIPDQVAFVGPDGKEAGRATTLGSMVDSALTFPAVEPLLKRAAEEPTIRFALDFNQLAKIAKIAKACDGEVDGALFLTFDYYEREAPVVIRSALASRVLALVMPTRTDAPVSAEAVRDAARLEEERADEGAAARGEVIDEVIDEVIKQVNEGALDGDGMKTTASKKGKNRKDGK